MALRLNMNSRYEDMRADRLLLNEFQNQMKADFMRVQGQNDIELLLSEFEKTFAAYIGTRHAIAVNSGSDALQLSLKALGIGKGDEIIIPNVSYPAVPLSILYNQATPVFVDIKREDLQINEALIKKAITKKTKAIICAHMFAKPCAIDNIQKLAGEFRLATIEDCCQAESSEYHGKKLGSFGDLSCFSFSYYKPLSSCGGGGGMVCFNDGKYERVRDYTKVWQDDDALLDIDKRYARMYFLDLVAIKAKFKYLKQIIRTRIKTRELYENKLSRNKDIRFLKDAPGSLSIPQNFVIFSKYRDSLGRWLNKNGIVWQKPYIPFHLMRIYNRFADLEYPQSEQYFRQAIHLPLFSFMKSEEVKFVAGVVNRFTS